MLARIATCTPSIMSELKGRDLIEPLDYQEFGEFLSERGIYEDVVSQFVSNRVNGSAFLKLSEED